MSFLLPGKLMTKLSWGTLLSLRGWMLVGRQYRGEENLVNLRHMSLNISERMRTIPIGSSSD